MATFHRHRARRGDAGMTLIEMVITVAIVGGMMVFVAAAVTVVFRTQGGVVDMTASSHDMQQTVSFFHRDVQSGPYERSGYRATTGTTGNTGNGCDVGGTSNVLRIDGDGHRIAYRLTGSGSTAMLDRYECVGSGASWTLRSVVNIADGLDPAVAKPVTAEVVAEPSDTSRVDRVILTVTSASLGEQEFSAEPRAAIAAAPPILPEYECQTSDPLNATRGFQTFVEGDAYLDGANVNQTLAIGGALSFNANVNLAQTISETPTVAGLQQAGLYADEIDWGATGAGSVLQVNSQADIALVDSDNSASSNQGSSIIVHEFGDLDEDPQIALQNGGSVIRNPTEIDITQAFDDIRSCGGLLAQLPDACSCAGHVTVSATNGDPYQGTNSDPAVQVNMQNNRVNVLNLTIDQANQLTSLKFSSAPRAGSPIIINVDTEIGDDIVFAAPQVQGGGSSAAYVVWNFPNADGEIFVTENLWGTLLAPSARVTSSHQIDGGVIARSLNFDGSSINASQSFQGIVAWD